ncbi:MAG: hypothetical protein ACREMB_01010, partial [Candidatus Rokuibacteriota bacterium]
PGQPTSSPPDGGGRRGRLPPPRAAKGVAMILITGLIGIAMLLAFMGFLVWWIKELPFTIIVVGVVVLLLYDFVRTLRYGEEGTRR